MTRDNIVGDKTRIENGQVINDHKKISNKMHTHFQNGLAEKSTKVIKNFNQLF